MKQLLVVAVMILVAASFVMGQTLGMATSKHNFAASSANTIKGASEKVCAYCHTPHVPATGIKAPLWSRKALLSTGYGVYSSATMDAAPTALAAGQDNVSSMCMSCHDGSALFASAAYVKRPDATIAWDEAVTVGNNANLHGGTTYGTGLTHTHPVNFVYDAALVTADGALQTAPLNNLPLYDSYMQCGSCHNPHSTDDKMTRATTDGGLLCISCHVK
jgi:predicted CXXCH cytochrome family protein